MVKDSAIQNQKVFVSLKATYDLQKWYLNTAQEYARLKEQGGTMASSYLERKRTIEQVIEMLELPMPKV
jgi:hypothetical protein